MVRVKSQRDATTETAKAVISSSALELRSKKERTKMEVLLAQKLRSDMLRMKNEELHADLTFIGGTHSILGHSIIVKCRSQYRIPETCFTVGVTGERELHLKYQTWEEIEQFLVALYSYEKVDAEFVLEGLKENDKKSELKRLSLIDHHVKSNGDTVCCLESNLVHGCEGDFLRHKELSEKGQNISEKAYELVETSQNTMDRHFDQHPCSLCGSDQVNCEAKLSSPCLSEMNEIYDNKIEAEQAVDKNVLTDMQDSSYPVGEEFPFSSAQADVCVSVFQEEKDTNISCVFAEHNRTETEETVSKTAPSVESIGISEIPDRTGAKSPDIVPTHNYCKGFHSQASREQDGVDSESLPDQKMKCEKNGCDPARVGLLEQKFSGSKMKDHSIQPDPKECFLARTKLEKEFMYQSSLGDKAEEQPLPHMTYSRLSSDLLRLYLDGVDADCCLLVEGQKFLVHRCILAARCEYFDAMFAGMWSESGIREIKLQGVSAKAMEYILLYFYGALVQMDIGSIASIIQAVDMLGVEGLTELICFHITCNLCHFFHKPCKGCMKSIADVLILAFQYNLTEIFDKGKAWSAKYFRRIWETQPFVNLPRPVLGACTQAVIDQLTIETITQVILDAHDLTRCLQRSHRAEHVFTEAKHVLDATLRFSAQHFPSIVQSKNFLSWSKSGAWCVDVLEESYALVVNMLQPECACEVYSNLRELLAQSEAAEGDEDHKPCGSEEVRRLLNTLIERCEWYLHRHIRRVMQCPQWSILPASFQQDLLQKSSFIPIQSVKCGTGQRHVAQKSAKAMQKTTSTNSACLLTETNRTLLPSVTRSKGSTSAAQAKKGKNVDLCPRPLHLPENPDTLSKTKTMVVREHTACSSSSDSPQTSKKSMKTATRAFSKEDCMPPLPSQPSLPSVCVGNAPQSCSAPASRELAGLEAKLLSKKTEDVGFQCTELPLHPLSWPQQHQVIKDGCHVEQSLSKPVQDQVHGIISMPKSKPLAPDSLSKDYNNSSNKASPFGSPDSRKDLAALPLVKDRYSTNTSPTRIPVKCIPFSLCHYSDSENCYETTPLPCEPVCTSIPKEEFRNLIGQTQSDSLIEICSSNKDDEFQKRPFRGIKETVISLVPSLQLQFIVPQE